MAATHLAFRPRPVSPADAANIIHGTGETAELIRRFDWTQTPLGPLASWSETLVATVNLMLASPVPTSLYWGPKHILLYNDGYRAFTGPRHPRSLGRPGAEVWSEAWHIVGPQIKQVMAGGETFFDPSCLVPIEVDGELEDRYWAYSFSPVFAHNTIAGVYNLCRDVTASTLAARERDALADRLEQVLASTSDGVVSIDREWRFRYLNEAARRAAGAANAENGKNLWECFPRLLDPALPNAFFYRRAMDKGIPGEFEAFYPEPLNHWLQIEVRPAANGIVLFFRDITERKRAAIALAQAANDVLAGQEELHWTIALSAQIPWTADANGTILSAAGNVGGLTGLAGEQMLGTGWGRLMHPEDAERMHRLWSHCVATGEPYEIEHRIQTATGAYRWFRSRAQPRRDATGTILKWYGNTEDIDARKKAEDALLVTEKLAATSRLAAAIAHEINNPLEAVTNLLYLAKTSPNVPEEVHEFLTTAELELRRASAITNQTLRFHRQASKPALLHTDELVTSGLAVFRGRMTNNNVTAEQRLRAQRPVSCFEGEIRQVFLNLTKNAIDAMKGTGGRLLIRTREATCPATGTPGLTLTVADTGPGMPPDVRSRIFEPFFTTKGVGGTGLGLWVSQEIVTRHGGRLRLRTRSNPHNPTGTGTVFALFLPHPPEKPS